MVMLPKKMAECTAVQYYCNFNTRYLKIGSKISYPDYWERYGRPLTARLDAEHYAAGAQDHTFSHVLIAYEYISLYVLRRIKR